LHFLAYFWQFFANFATIKKLSKNISARIIFVVDAIFLPNVAFLGPFSPEISFGEKTVTHPAYFAIREPQCSALSNKYSA